MPGFTPINASSLAKPTSPTDTSLTASNERAEALKSKQPSKSVSRNTGTIAALYQDTADTTLRGNGVRKAASKGKKRTRQAASEPRSKRCKSSQIAAVLPVKKSGVSSSKAPDASIANDTSGRDVSSTEIEAASALSKAKLSAYRHKAVVGTTDSAHGNASNNSRPVSIYAQQTSMDTVSSFQPRTTMQAVQQAVTGGSTIYDSTAIHASVIDAVETPRPWLNAISKKAAATANTRVLRPRNGTALIKEPSLTQLQTPPDSDHVTCLTSDQEVSGKVSSRKKTRSTLRTKSDEEFATLDDEDELELIDLSAGIEATAKAIQEPPTRDRNQNMRDVHEYEDYGGALFSASEKAILGRLKAAKPQRRPVVRMPFPSAILDRSPLFGVSGTSILRTCFRVGEALNTGCQAVRTNKTVVLELYARVTASHHEPKPSRKQHFVIKDMYHDNPPYLHGTFELWDQSALWELDSTPFLSAGEEGVLCRMIARMKRDGTKWRLEILSIWPADWDDVEHVAGIYAKQQTDDDE